MCSEYDYHEMIDCIIKELKAVIPYGYDQRWLLYGYAKTDNPVDLNYFICVILYLTISCQFTKELNHTIKRYIEQLILYFIENWDGNNIYRTDSATYWRKEDVFVTLITNADDELKIFITLKYGHIKSN